MRRILALLTGLALALPAAAAQGPGCGAPGEWLQAPPLPAVAAGLTAGRLSILAVGTASITGAGTSTPAAAWPARLEALLRERRPDLQLRVEVRGTRGSTAAEQWQQIEQVLRAGPPSLVIWQAGTTEALRSLPIDDMAAALSQGLERLYGRGVDTVVMGIQFSRFIRANVDVDPYRDALRVVAGASHAGFFSRYDIMRTWVEAGAVDVERAPAAHRTAEIDKLNDCLARALAAFLRDGVQQARR